MIRLLTRAVFLFIIVSNSLTAESLSRDQVSRALNCLDRAINLGQSIKDEGERASVLCCLKELKVDIQKAVQTNDLKDLHDSCMCLCENMHEILAECSDRELCTKIVLCVNSMID